MVWVSLGRKLGPWSEFSFLYRFTVLLNSGGSNSPWSKFWSEFPHFMGMGVVPAPSRLFPDLKRFARIRRCARIRESIRSAISHESGHLRWWGKGQTSGKRSISVHSGSANRISGHSWLGGASEVGLTLARQECVCPPGRSSRSHRRASFQKPFLEPSAYPFENLQRTFLGSVLSHEPCP